MVCKAYPFGSLKQYKYALILSEYQGKFLLSRHKERTTWETQGGHIEPGETPLEAAKRELFEESGAVDFELMPLCDCRAGDLNTDHWDNGIVYRAVIRKLSPLPESEMAEVQQFDTFPKNLTYPEIVSLLFNALRKETESK